MKNFINKFLEVFKIEPIKLKNIIDRNQILKNVDIEKFDRNCCGHRIYLWDLLNSGKEFDFYIEKKLGKIKYDIQNINDVSSSKSRLEDFQDLNDVVQKNSKDLIHPINEEKLKENFNYERSIIFHNKGDVIFTPFNNRIQWINSDGSHHFMAARYIAGELNRKIEIECTTIVKFLNSEYINSFLEKYSIFLINCPKTDNTPEINLLIKGIKDFKVEHKKIYNERYKLLFLLLKKENKRENKIIDLLEQNGFLNIKNYFYKYLDEQEKNLKSIGIEKIFGKL